MKKMIVSAVLIFLGGLTSSSFAGALKIDFSPNNGRKDVLTFTAENSLIDEGISIQQRFGDLHLNFNAVDGSLLSAGWWKAGYDFKATLASDGITTKNPGVIIKLEITGLSAGEHRLAFWHNCWDATPSGQIQIDAGTGNIITVKQSHRVLNDDLASTSYMTVTAELNKPVVIQFSPQSKQDRVYLSGMSLDVPNPARQAHSPTPFHTDEHAVENPVLSWQAPRENNSRVDYQLYLGTDQQRVASATEQAPEFQGTLASTSYQTKIDDPQQYYYWRVDTRDSEGKITVGDIWKFQTRQIAFPGAEGYGRYAKGGRWGPIIEVTNLNDAGPGSLREAVEAIGPRIVIFKVGGTIQLKSKLVIHNPYLTVAGQTAPGQGICIRGYTFGCMGAHDIILRYLRIRVGDDSGVTMDGTGFASCDHCIMDHCSISWSIDEAVSSRSAKNITVQRCIVAEALNIANHQKYGTGKGHSFAGSISGNIGSFHHNLLAHCAGRNWSLAGGLDNGGHLAGKLDIRNNVVYNWEHRTNDGGVKALNLVNNLYLPGPATRVFHLLKPDTGTLNDPQQYYMNGNIMEGHPEYSSNNWVKGSVIVDEKALPRIKLNKPFCESYVTTHPAKSLEDIVLSDVGANHAGHDSVDLRVINDVKSRKFSVKGSKGNLPGIIDSQADVQGWPVLETGQAEEDTDHDGIADTWEAQHGLNPQVADHNRVMNKQHETAMDLYLNDLTSSRNADVKKVSLKVPAIQFELEKDQLRFKTEDQPLGVYVFHDQLTTRPYFAHLKTHHGLQVTRNHPPVKDQDKTDHERMHPGIWLSFGDINGHDYWRLKAVTKHIKFLQEPKVEGETLAFTVLNHYLSTDQKSIVCEETCSYQISYSPETLCGYLITQESEFKTSMDQITFGDQEEMGLGIRLNTPLAVEKKLGGRILDDQGRLNAAGIWGKTVDWADYAGPLDNHWIGMTVFNETTNIRPAWCHARDYGFFAMNPFGLHAFTKQPRQDIVLKKGQSLKIKFGILIHDSTTEADYQPAKIYQNAYKAGL